MLASLASGLPPVKWIPTTTNSIPPNALKGGHDTDGTPLYIARAWFQGGLHVGFACRTRPEGCSISYGGFEHIIENYEILVLVGNPASLRWFDHHGQFDPTDAKVIGAMPVEAGRESMGSPLYICRSVINGGLYIGKCGPVLKHGHYPYQGIEHLEISYQVLCRV
eukprot:jgi/Hompol1/3706/HPOL_006693-RA